MECRYGAVREARTNGALQLMRILSGFERLLLLGGLLLVAAYAAARFYSVVYSPATLRDFWLNQAATAHQRVRLIQPNSRIPDFRLWSPKRMEAYQTGASTNVPAPLGVLKISSVGIEVPVLEGTDDLTLNRAVGHIDETPDPGEEGKLESRGTGTDFSGGLKTPAWATPLTFTPRREIPATLLTKSVSFLLRTSQFSGCVRGPPSRW